MAPLKVILSPMLLAICAGACDYTIDTSKSPRERVLNIQFANSGEHTWLGLVPPDGGYTRGEDEVWLCSTEGDTCALRVREALGKIELVALSAGREMHRATIDLEAKVEKEMDLSINFRDGGSIAGRVVGVDGGTIAEARVDIRKHADYFDTLPEEARHLSARTGDAGEFGLAGFGAGSYSALVTAPDHVSLEFDFEMDGDGLVELDVELSSAREVSVLRGEVFDAGSLEAVEEFVVEISAPDGRSTPLTRRFTTADGVFEWSGLPQGRWNLAVNADGFGSFRASALELPPNGTVEARFGLRAGRLVRGQVVDVSTGVGIPSAKVTVAEPSLGLDRTNEGPRTLATTLTDEKGLFDVPGLPWSPVSVTAAAEAYVGSGTTILYELDGELEIALSAGATLLGRILDYERPGEIDGTQVSIWPSGIDSSLEKRTANVEEDGTFMFQGLAPGRYGVELTHASGQTLGGFDIAPGDRYRDFEIQLPGRHEAAARIRGRVFGLRPGEVAKIESKPEVYSARVGRGGDYEMELSSLRAIWGVIVSTSHGRSITKTLKLKEGESKTVDFSLRGADRLRGRVTRNGTPAQGSVVRARRSYEDSELNGEHQVEYLVSEPIGRDGRYEFTGVTVGDYILFIEGRRTRVSVKGDTRLDVNLCADSTEADEPYKEGGELICDDLSISGKVVSGGASLSHASVVLLGDKLAPKFVISDDRGAFHFVHLVPGEYRLAVHKAGYEPLGTRIELSADSGHRAGKTEVSVRLTPSGESPFWVTTPRPPPKFVIIELRDAHGERLWFPLPIDGSGRGLLPLSLAGRRFDLKHPAVEPVIVQNWQGQTLEVRFSECRDSPSTCIGWTWQDGVYWPYQYAR